MKDIDKNTVETIAISPTSYFIQRVEKTSYRFGIRGIIGGEILIYY